MEEDRTTDNNELKIETVKLGRFEGNGTLRLFRVICSYTIDINTNQTYVKQ